MRTVGQTIGKMRRMASEFQGQFMEAMREVEREADLDSVKKEFQAISDQAKIDTSFDPVGMMRDDMTKAVRTRRARPRPSPLMRPTPEIGKSEIGKSGDRSERSGARRGGRSGLTRRRSPRRPPPGEARRNEPRGHRRHQGAVDGPSDRAPGSHHQVALRLPRRLFRLLLFLPHDLQRADLPLCARGRRGKGDADRHPFPRAVLHQHPAQHVRGGRHRLSGDRGADLQIHRARPLPQRAAGVSALSDRHAHLLPDGRAARLFRGDAAPDPLLGVAAAGQRSGRGDDRASAQGRANICR